MFCGIDVRHTHARVLGAVKESTGTKNEWLLRPAPSSPLLPNTRTRTRTHIYIYVYKRVHVMYIHIYIVHTYMYCTIEYDVQYII